MSFPRFLSVPLLFCASSALPLLPLRAQDSTTVLKVVGSATVNQPVSKIAQILRKERSIPVLISTHGGSSEAVRAVGEGRAEIGLLSRPLSTTERATYPKASFKEFYFGEHVLALVVSADIWNSGVKAISKERLRLIYEKKINNWKEVGGPDKEIKFFNPAEGEGSWEILVDWLYGDPRMAPTGKFEVSESHEMAKASVEFIEGSMVVMPPAMADGERSFPLALIDERGQYLRPTPRQIASGEYPLVRHMLMITNDRPTGPARLLIELLTGPEGQGVVEELGLVPVAAVRAAGGNAFAPAQSGPSGDPVGPGAPAVPAVSGNP